MYDSTALQVTVHEHLDNSLSITLGPKLLAQYSSDFKLKINEDQLKAA